MKLYTKTGDDGTTGLYGGDRTLKTTFRIKAIGDVDELNACVGVVRLYNTGEGLDEMLSRIQNWLFDLGAELACPPGGKFSVAVLSAAHSEALERSMDEQNEVLPSLKEFILPGGSAAGAHLHLARCVCRRAERSILELHGEEPVRAEARVFMNRLSDWFFVSARTANRFSNVNDNAWRQSEIL